MSQPGTIVFNDSTRVVTTYDPAGAVVSTRPYTTAENAAADAAAAAATAGLNAADLVTKARSALTNNTTYLAIASPTNAQVSAQVAKLTRQVDALIKLEVNDLQAVDGT